MLEGDGWRHLPHAGGLLDQDERLWHDLMEISSAYNRLTKPGQDAVIARKFSKG